MSPCANCSGKCCTKFYIPVTVFDIVLIAERTGVEPSRFLTPYCGDGLMEPVTYPKFKLNGDDFFLGMDAQMGKKDCIFLMDINGTRRCGIHAFRPISCRVYPFRLSSERMLETAETLLCPRQWWPEGIEREKYMSYIGQFGEQLKRYREILEKWNSREDGDFINFLEFIINEAGDKNALHIRDN